MNAPKRSTALGRVIGRLARQIERWLVRRGMNRERVRTFRRWSVAVMSFALVLLTLNLARIPLSVFAFLGGALAIGVGFGTQTIIKNFISGMILLVERRVQIGDVIEIDGVEGTVTTVDLRSSTVRSGDGRETLVPNSVLLEHKVTNWTLSNGIRVILKPTDFKADEVLILGTSPGGASLMTPTEFPRAREATTLVTEGGVGAFTQTDLQKALAGKAASAFPGIGELTEQMFGRGSPKDLETVFQLMSLGSRIIWK